MSVITIIPEDAVVLVDSVAMSVDVLSLGSPEGVRALQWSGGVGWIEFKDADNVDIDHLPSWAIRCVDEHQDRLSAYLNLLSSAPAKEEMVRNKRDELLRQTDWTASTDVTMSDEMRAYRQALRDVPAQAGFPDNVTWPTKP